MTRMMSNHRPPRKRERTQPHHRNNPHAQSHGEHSHQSTNVAPHDHFVEVTDVSFALVLFEFVSEFLHVGGEGVVVVGFDPLVAFCELGRGGGGWHAHRFVCIVV